MQDVDEDLRSGAAHRLRADPPRLRQGREYPFRVAGYKIGSVGLARGKTVVLTLVEKTVADDVALVRRSVILRHSASGSVR
jgi:hypothetical protein